ELRRRMHADAGVMRNAAGLTSLHDWIDAAAREHGAASPLEASRLIVAAALARTESRGGHYRSDHPEAVAAVRSLVRRGADGAPVITHLPVDATTVHDADPAIETAA